ncbi:MAG: 4-hydroxy-tetrahydrodipicolinate reductase [Verrucomicrobiae bacterium]|nr:4-hydroxy-tetrahydrodipicolinate reductase [Verrucomicrobiae bacterium]
MKPVKVIISGAKGRMGQTLLACAKNDPGLQIVAGIDLGDDLSQTIGQCDVVVEFALHEATLATAKLCAANKKAFVIGTTGHTDSEQKQIREIVQGIPCVWTGNYSTGVNTLYWITRKVAEITGKDWNIEISETHHTAKKDAPSGTAKNLRDAIGRDVPIHSLRIGDVVGDHTVTFGIPGERLELTHRASSREIFARGALHAAKWAARQPADLYSMQDVLGLK